jgi:Flp pilus assembly pilin Flp
MIMKKDCLKVCSLPHLLRRFITCESGAMQVAEYLLMGSIIAIGVLVGLVSYRDALALEYGDTAAALKNLDQSYSFTLTGTSPTTSSFSDTVGFANTISVTSPAASGEQ